MWITVKKKETNLKITKTGKKKQTKQKDTSQLRPRKSRVVARMRLESAVTEGTRVCQTKVRKKEGKGGRGGGVAVEKNKG